MKILKPKLIATLLCLSGIFSISSTAHANEYTLRDGANNTFVKQFKNWGKTPLDLRIDSTSNGANIQNIAYSIEILNSLGLDEAYLAQSIENVSDHVAQYFKKNRNLRGMMFLEMIVFPGYKTPYQFNLDFFPQDKKDALIPINKALMEQSKCNPQGFCTMFSLSNYTYLPLGHNPQYPQDFNPQEFIDHYNTSTHPTPYPYHTSKEANKALIIKIFMGTNGYVMNSEDIKKITKQ